jgi:hypothetical protein
MTTTLSDIGDLFMSSLSDYKLDILFSSSGSYGLNTYIEPYLLKSIMDFNICTQVLNYTTITSGCDGYFDTDLTNENKIVLSELMQLYWLQKGIQNSLYLGNLLADHDLKVYSPAQTLQARQSNYNAKREEISQRMVDYSYRHNTWGSWNNQIYGSG